MIFNNQISGQINRLIRDSYRPQPETEHPCPTLIIHADQDAVFSLRDSRTLHAGIHGARLARIQHCGHMSPMEAPEEVTALMQAWMNDEHFPMME